MTSTQSNHPTMLKQLRSRFASDLDSFASSPTKFRILWSDPASPSTVQSSSTPTSNSTTQPRQSLPPPKVLHVLDSSFNPPSRAHLGIAISSLQSTLPPSLPTANSTADHQNETLFTPSPSPQRILLLLATNNADKAPKPAAFADRLVMMTLLAAEIRHHFSVSSSTSSQSPSNGVQAEQPSIPIAVDVGVTTEPYFHAKALAIRESDVYSAVGTGDVESEQVYAVGFDSLLRIFDRKYYGDDGFRVLEPFFERCRVRATVRVDKEEWGGVEGQRGFVEKIERGEREDEGVKREWGGRIELVESTSREEGEGVSSTNAREAVKTGDGERLRRMCVESVAEYVEMMGLYREDQGENQSGNRL